MEFITDPSERYPQSKTMDAHQKSSSKSTWARDNRTIALYMVENFKHWYELRQYAYASMLVQAEAMCYAFSGWTRLWKGPEKEECSGALVWRLNDAWPCVSWSLIDFNLRPKYAYYTVKRAIAPLTVGVTRVVIETSRDDELTAVHIHREQRLHVWATNFGVDEMNMELLVQGIDVLSGNTTWERRLDVVVLANQSIELLDERLENPTEQTVFLARLIEKDKIIARFAEWPQPLRHLDLPKPSVDIRLDDDHIHVSSPLPVKGLVFEIDDDQVVFDDNCIDLMPGDNQVVLAKGLNGRSIAFMHLGIAAD